MSVGVAKNLISQLPWQLLRTNDNEAITDKGCRPHKQNWGINCHYPLAVADLKDKSCKSAVKCRNFSLPLPRIVAVASGGKLNKVGKLVRCQCLCPCLMGVEGIGTAKVPKTCGTADTDGPCPCLSVSHSWCSHQRWPFSVVFSSNFSIPLFSL